MALSLKISFPDERMAEVQKTTNRSRHAGGSAEEFTVTPMFVTPRQAPIVAYLQVLVVVDGRERLVQAGYLQLSGVSGRVSLVDCSNAARQTYFERQLLSQSAEGVPAEDAADDNLSDPMALEDFEDPEDSSEES